MQDGNFRRFAWGPRIEGSQPGPVSIPADRFVPLLLDSIAPMTAQTAKERIFNFSPGPAVLPLSVLERIRDEMLCLPGAGCSILEISHRDKQFLDILHGAEQGIRRALGISDQYAVLFLQGGARLQFSMVSANLLRGTEQTARYLVTGSWSEKALPEAQKDGNAVSAWSGKGSNYNTLPSEGEYEAAADDAYLYYCSNETIQGVQFHSEPACPNGVPLVCDASSDFLSRPLEIDRYGVLYACAQKNAGPAGVTVVIVRRDLMDRAPANLPGYMRWKNHAENDSEWNTPPTFAIYALGLVLDWLENEVGGLAAMHERNRRKAQMLYEVIDEYPELYIGHAEKSVRSLMNVTFRFDDEDLQKQFLAGAAEHNLGNLKGHRSVGGIRASIYNAMPVEGVETLAQYMQDFARKSG